MKHHHLQQNGYTLIELMIVVTMVGIISSMAYSAFTGYTASADRAQGQSDLYEIAQIMERNFTENRSYALSNADRDAILAPYNNNTTRYVYSATLAANSFDITATVGDSRDDIDLQINQAGVEEWKDKTDSSWEASTGWDNIN
ncbi:MAG: prepilin-type N-terminal cleavage/methylation domain-containing protein [Acidiferrobacterales bacterium]|nr:prepilin-type N-terminal cleavage/methylation domain-containing protein [Acidiferrobacterales bacterium]